MSRLQVTWRGYLVGFIEDPVPNMWYLEGKWLPENSLYAQEFHNVTALLNPAEVLQNPAQGVAVYLSKSEAVREETLAIVVAPPEATLLVRRVFNEEAKLWLTDDNNSLTDPQRSPPDS
jgi:hypothetical protein